MDTYAGLKTDIANWLNREGFTTLEDMVDTFLGMAQRRIYREMDLHCMEDTVTDTVDTLTLPSDFLRTKALYIIHGTVSQEVTGGSYHNLLPISGTGVPKKYAIVGSEIVMSPTPGDNYTYNLLYYKSLPLLSDGNTTNWFTTNCPELILFAALLEASLFLKDDVRSGVWSERYNDLKKTLELSDLRQDKEYGGMAVQIA
jgi:hypothetical protein